MTELTVFANFTYACQTCGETVRVVGGKREEHPCPEGDAVVVSGCGVPNLAEPAASEDRQRCLTTTHTGEPCGPDCLAQPLSRDEQWEAEKVVTSLPALDYDWTTIADYNAAQAWAVEAYLAAVARVRADALRSFAAEMRTLAEQAPEGEPARWPWSAYALAAVKAEERAGSAGNVEAGVRADERRRVAEEIAQAIEDISGALACPWTRTEAAATARDHAGPPAERVQDAPTDAGTPEHPRASVVIQGNPCCGGNGDEANCEECR